MIAATTITVGTMLIWTALLVLAGFVCAIWASAKAGTATRAAEEASKQLELAKLAEGNADGHLSSVRRDIGQFLENQRRERRDGPKFHYFWTVCSPEGNPMPQFWGFAPAEAWTEATKGLKKNQSRLLSDGYSVRFVFAYILPKVVTA